MDVWWVIAIVLTLLLGVPPLMIMWANRNSHVRKLWVRLDHIWENGTRRGAWLTLNNGSEWPIWNTVVIAPESLTGKDFDSIGPGETRKYYIPETELSGISDDKVTVQVDDSRRKTWLWTPLGQVLSPIPPRLTPFARLVQWLARKLPDRAEENFYALFLSRLPRRLIIFFWGYDPVEGDSGEYLENHLREAQSDL